MRMISMLTAALTLAGGSAAAQTPVFIEARGGYAIPTGDWNEGDAIDNGFSIGLNVIGMFTPQVGAYAGWEVVRSDAEDEQPDVDADASDVGFRAGLTASIPLPRSPQVTPFVEVGAVYNKVQFGASTDEGTVILESESALGFEAGLGASVGVHPRVSISPSVRYRQHEVELLGLSDTVEYIMISVGARLRL
jgi:opacity protein-like surface antigen